MSCSVKERIGCPGRPRPGRIKIFFTAEDAEDGKIKGDSLGQDPGQIPCASLKTIFRPYSFSPAFPPRLRLEAPTFGSGKIALRPGFSQIAISYFL
jgi:hypothetical protein